MWDSGREKPLYDLRHEAGLAFTRRSGQQQRLPASRQLLDDGGRLGAPDVGTVDQGSGDPADVGLVAVVDPRPNLRAGGERLLGRSRAPATRSAHRPQWWSVPAGSMRKSLRSRSTVGRLGRLAISTLDERRNPLLHGTERVRPCPICLEFGSPQLQVRVDCTSWAMDVTYLSNAACRLVGQQAAEILKDSPQFGTAR